MKDYGLTDKEAPYLSRKKEQIDWSAFLWMLAFIACLVAFCLAFDALV